MEVAQNFPPTNQNHSNFEQNTFVIGACVETPNVPKRDQDFHHKTVGEGEARIMHCAQKSRQKNLIVF